MRGGEEDDESFEMTPVLHQTMYDSINLAEFTMHGQKGARCQVQCRDQDIYKVNELSFLEAHLAYVYVHAI